MSILIALAGCAGSDIERATSCAELEDAWEAAGGLNADDSVQLDTLEQVNVLGTQGDLSDEDVLTCGDLGIETQRALACNDPRLSLPDEECS